MRMGHGNSLVGLDCAVQMVSSRARAWPAGFPAPSQRDLRGTVTALSHNQPGTRTVLRNATTAVNSGEAVTAALAFGRFPRFARRSPRPPFPAPPPPPPPPGPPLP